MTKCSVFRHELTWHTLDIFFKVYRVPDIFMRSFSPVHYGGTYQRQLEILCWWGAKSCFFIIVLFHAAFLVCLFWYSRFINRPPLFEPGLKLWGTCAPLCPRSPLRVENPFFLQQREEVAPLSFLASVLETISLMGWGVDNKLPSSGSGTPRHRFLKTCLILRPKPWVFVKPEFLTSRTSVLDPSLCGNRSVSTLFIHVCLIYARAALGVSDEFLSH